MGRKYIEEGWKSYRSTVVPSNASDIQLKETRQAFFAGVAILFEVLMMDLDPGKEPTDEDMRRMDDLHAEIDEYGQSLDRRYFGKRKH